MLRTNFALCALGWMAEGNGYLVDLCSASRKGQEIAFGIGHDPSHTSPMIGGDTEELQCWWRSILVRTAVWPIYCS